MYPYQRTPMGNPYISPISRGYLWVFSSPRIPREQPINTMVVHVRERGTPVLIPWNMDPNISSTTYVSKIFPPKKNLWKFVFRHLFGMTLKKHSANKIPKLVISQCSYVGISKNSFTPKSSILIGFSIINHPFWVPLFLETPMSLYWSTHILYGIFR